jgi:hypothetical protein
LAEANRDRRRIGFATPGAQERKPLVPQPLLLRALGGATGGFVGFEDGDFLLRAGALVGFIVVDVVVGAAFITGEIGRRREVGHPDVGVDRVPPAAVGKVEGVVFVVAKWKIRVYLHFLHFVALRPAQDRGFDEGQRPGDALVIAGTESLQGESPVDGL